MNRPFCGLVLVLLVFCGPGSGHGFYESQGAASSLALRGFLSGGFGLFTYPAGSAIYAAGDDRVWSGDLRLLVEKDGPEDFHLTANVLQSSRAKGPFLPGGNDLLPLDVERSSLLTWEQHDSGRARAELVVDQLYLQYRTGRLDLALGRQPVNLATTFYFRPNDFFAPFAPQTFFRNYKPGVDGVRGDFRLAELSQLTLVGVLAYDRDPAAANGWNRGPDWSETSLLLRMTRELGGFAGSLLFATVAGQTISGGSLEGEIFKRIGLRAEGHYSAAEEAGGHSCFKLALGLEKLYSNNFSWRLEYFQAGRAGSGNWSSPQLSPGHNRDYAALGLGYEFTPLLNSSFLALAGLGDDSGILSANFLYSLSDETELSTLLSLPFGEAPRPDGVGSEFGGQPRSVMLEYRAYF